MNKVRTRLAILAAALGLVVAGILGDGMTHNTINWSPQAGCLSNCR